ncbi:hypothetical protein A2U01_0011964, partial [Trifolium medium]|nr:hypothetical protein [Trifolium medium]
VERVNMSHSGSFPGRQPPPSPTRPPETTQASKQKCSFRDKLLGNQAPIPRRETIDLIGQKLFRIEFENGDRRRPRCYTDDSVLKDLWLPWQHAVIVKLLGKTLGFVTMRDRLRAIWKLTGDMDMMSIGHGFFMVKFDLEADRDKVISGGPWMIYDHCVAIRPWTTDFISSQVQINKTHVWIRFPSLGMEYYDESLLLALATAVGRPIKVDIHTLDASRGKFARVCIEIDLDKPVVGKVWFRDFWYKVEYEGLHLLCQRCGIYGHVSRNCPPTDNAKKHTEADTSVKAAGGVETTVPSVTESPPNTDMESNKNDINNEDLYGDWLVVNRKKNRKSRPKNQEERAGVTNLGKPLGKGVSFAHLTDVGKENDDGGAKFHVMGSKFHP